MKRLLITFIGFAIIIFTLTSCAFNFTKNIANELQPVNLYESYNTKPLNLGTRSKCPLPPSINIVNMETRDENYLMNRGITKLYINPKELTNYIVDYMKDAFEKCMVKIDANSTKTIQVSMKKAEFTQGLWAQGAYIQLKIDIPEKQYTEVYEATDNAYNSVMRAMAYAIHATTWKIIADPIIQDYILCR